LRRRLCTAGHWTCAELETLIDGLYRGHGASNYSLWRQGRPRNLRGDPAASARRVAVAAGAQGTILRHFHVLLLRCSGRRVPLSVQNPVKGTHAAPCRGPRAPRSVRLGAMNDTVATTGGSVHRTPREPIGRAAVAPTPADRGDRSRRSLHPGTGVACGCWSRLT
jgi:hypothetical protein